MSMQSDSSAAASPADAVSGPDTAGDRGTLYGLGLGPGDPELITLKALHILQRVPVIAYPAPEDSAAPPESGLARSIAAPHLPGTQTEIPIRLPFRSEREPARAAYDEAATLLTARLAAGQDVAVLCAGDPMLYGSFMYLLERLAPHTLVRIIPGVTSIQAAAAAVPLPLVERDEPLAVLPATLSDTELRHGLEGAAAAAILKLGRHFGRIRQLLAGLDLLEKAWYVERVTQTDARVQRLAEIEAHEAPYFSLVLVRKEPVRRQGA